MSKTSSHIALSAENLSIGYTTKKKETTIAKDIHFLLNSGELACIIGSNGIGKSTLLRTLAKVQPALSGNIEINEEPLLHYSDLRLAKTMSVVLTEPIVSKNMTVAELVALGRQPYTNWIGTLSETDISKIREALRMVELEELQNQKCFELSDGQLQRVMIARALAQDTALILLDEPTTHLDLYHKVQILKLLKSIAHQTNKIILFTSHEIEMAIQLCDKMLLMNAQGTSFGKPGELIENGSFDSLFPSDTVSFDSQTRTFRIGK